MKFPGFSGKDEEDFSKFKTEMEAAIISHRVPKQEQIKKLRDCLKLDALKLVPDSKETTLASAWEILQKAYGDPTRVIKHRKQALLDLGKCPKEIKGVKNFKAHISWYASIESFLRDIIALGKNNPDYEDIAFSPDFPNGIITLFPTGSAY